MALHCFCSTAVDWDTVGQETCIVDNFGVADVKQVSNKHQSDWGTQLHDILITYFANIPSNGLIVKVSTEKLPVSSVRILWLLRNSNLHETKILKSLMISNLLRFSGIFWMKNMLIIENLLPSWPLRDCIIYNDGSFNRCLVVILRQQEIR